MPRPLNRRQTLENAAFLEALRQTGNVRLAARTLGRHRATFTKRRAKHAAFAAEWEAALAAAHAAFHLAGGTRAPEILPGTGRGTARRSRVVEGSRAKRACLRTKGGEPTIVRLANGRLQLRLAPPGRMTKAAEQVFFRALSASANVRLAAAAAGFAHSSFYAKKRTHAAFAREMRVAIDIGCDRLESALTERAFQLFGEGAPWRDGVWDGNPLPPMTVSQCIHLVTLHQNRDRLRSRIDRAARSPAPFEETREGHCRRREAAERARHYEETGNWRLPHEPPPPALPALALVTGWSKAKPVKAVHNPNLALFGGWRLKDWKKREGKR